MKNKRITAICTILLFIPWTILPLRSNAWALKSPSAEIIISAYSVFMIFSGIFTVHHYGKGKIQNRLMKVCTVISAIYAIGGIAVFCMMILPKLRK